MKRVLGKILCNLEPNIEVKGQKAGICYCVPSTSLVFVYLSQLVIHYETYLLDELLQSGNLSKVSWSVSNALLNLPLQSGLIYVYLSILVS